MQNNYLRRLSSINHHFWSFRQFICNMSSSSQSPDSESKELLAQQIKSSRKWINVNHCKRVKNDIDFTIVSWNILSQDLIDIHSELYTECSYKSLEWSQRCQKILKYLFNAHKRYRLICLQELNYLHYEKDFLPYITRRGYKSIYKRRSLNRQDGCAIIYDEDIFELDSYEFVHLGNPRVILDVQRQRDNVGIIALFRPKVRNSHFVNNSSNGKFIVATTHLFFNPKRGDIKLSQLRLFLAEIWKAATYKASNDKVKQLPVILCGDLNLVPKSLIYNFIVDGTIEPLGIRAGDLSGQIEGCEKGPYMSHENFRIPALSSDCCFIDNNSSTSENQVNQVTGNSNQESESNLNNLNSENYSKVSHKFKFLSVIPPFHPKTNESYASSKVRDADLVDYIFYTQQSNYQMESKLSLISYYKLPTISQLDSFGPLPNFLIPSDHLPLEARFVFHPYSMS